jgi:hypothetical protein
MVETFQEYNDIVLAMGLSHLARNAGIFDTADLSVGVDVLLDSSEQGRSTSISEGDQVYPHEIDLVTSISTSSCIFRLQGPSSTAHLPDIISIGRAAIETAGAAIVLRNFGMCSFLPLYCVRDVLCCNRYPFHSSSRICTFSACHASTHRTLYGNGKG